MFRRLRPFQIVVDVSVALVFGLIAIPAELGIDMQLPGARISAVLLVVSMTAALGIRRLSPGLALAVAWAGALMQMGFGRSPGFADLAIFAVLFATAAYGGRVVFWAGFGSVIVGAGAITVYLFRFMFGPQAGLSDIPTAVFVLIAALFALGLAWTAGALVRTAIRARATRAAQSRAEAETAAEQERTRIARDMHDIVAHSLAVIIAQSDGARYAAAADPEAQTQALGTISSTARAALSDVRLLLTQLRHSQTEGPQPTLADLEQLYAQVRAAGVALRVDVDPAPHGEVAASVQLAVYRILQEALTNALRHGGGTVDVALAWHPDRVELSVRNPVSIDAPADRRPPGHGLIGMRERAQLIGGSLDAAPENGVFTVAASLPCGPVTVDTDAGAPGHTEGSVR
ncbi:MULTISPECIES: sensor histidine kinase [unclassified Microbacterium]|uniref:sensor histidine kinase n=1 Tax=unclassified Microbacterium TaxID=2609290 RepID=UPI003868299A